MWSRRLWARAWRRSPCAWSPRAMTRWDAVVVGAGPAGSATARLLAQPGARVLLLDRAQFPRDKPCSEYLSPQSTRVLEQGLSRRSEEHTSELQSPDHLVCRLLLEKKKTTQQSTITLRATRPSTTT